MIREALNWYFSGQTVDFRLYSYIAIACHLFLESLCLSGQFWLSGNNYTSEQKKDLKSISSKPERGRRCRSPQELREEESASDH